ncbi:MAG: hypothetical protein ABIO76_08490 [Ginsengibacter sp.]
MKKIILYALAIPFLAMASCKSNSGDPKLVLTKFFDAIGKKDLDEAKKYVTKDSEGMLNLMQMGMQNMKDNSDNILNYGKENIEYGNAVIDGDKATVPIKDKKSGEVTDFTLKNESGQWKVAFDKSTLMEMAQKKMKEHGGMGKMRDRLNDLPDGLDKESSNIDSIRNKAMEKAQKIMDSVNKK